MKDDIIRALEACFREGFTRKQILRIISRCGSDEEFLKELKREYWGIQKGANA